MKSNLHSFLVSLVRVNWSALLVCGVMLAFMPQGFAAEKPAASGWAIQVEPVQVAEGQLPAEFSMAIYENVIAQLAKDGEFQKVFRSGDHRADDASNLLVLRMKLEKFNEGSQTKRAVTTVAGATKLKVHLTVSTRDGKVLIEKDVQGAVRVFGENLRATYDLAKHITGTVRKAPLPAPVPVTATQS